MDQVIPNQKRAAIYSRVSTDEQREGKTIDSQIDENVKFCQKHGYSIIESYKDDGFSGSRIDRPSLIKMIADAENGLFDLVVCNSIDRFARDDYVFAFITHKLEKIGIKVEFTKVSISDDSNGRLLRTILASFATFERATIAERMKRGKRYKVEVRKEFIGCIPSYGYDYFPGDKAHNKAGELKINEREAKVVKLIFDWVGKEGSSAKEAVRRLTKMGFATRKGGSTWSRCTILKIIKNESYIGKFHYNKVECVENGKSSDVYRKNQKNSRRIRPRNEWITLELPHLRIVSDVLFSAAQLQLAKNRCFSKRNSKNQYLFAGGILKCGKCGCSYHGMKIHGYSIYRDGNLEKRFPFEKTCDSPSIMCHKVEGVVWLAIAKAVTNPDFLVNQIKVLGLSKTIGAKDDSEAKLISENINGLKIQETRIIEAYKNSIISLDQLKHSMKNIAEAKKESENKLNGLKNDGKRKSVDLETQKGIEQFCKAVKARINKANFEQKRDIIRTLVDKIDFFGDRLVIYGIISSTEANGDCTNVGKFKISRHL